MIAIKLMGGLGNQMFQYAFGRKISLDKNTKLALDLTFFNNQAEVDTPRHYELDCYKINPKLITKQIPDSKPLLYPLIKRNYFLHRYLEGIRFQRRGFRPTRRNIVSGVLANGEILFKH